MSRKRDIGHKILGMPIWMGREKSMCMLKVLNSPKQIFIDYMFYAALQETLGRDITSLRFSNFSSEIKKRMEKIVFFYFSLPLIIDGSRSRSAAASYCA